MSEIQPQTTQVQITESGEHVIQQIIESNIQVDQNQNVQTLSTHNNEAEIEAKRKQQQELEKRKKQLHDKNTDYQAEINQHLINLAQIQSTVNQKTQQIEGFKHLLRTKQQKHNEHEVKQLKINDKNDQVLTLYQQLESNQQNLQAQVKSNTQKVNELKNEISKLEENLKTKQAEQQASIISISVHKKMEELQQNLSKVQGNKNQQTQNLNDLKNKSNGKKTEIQIVAQKLADVLKSNNSEDVNKLSEKQKQIRNQIQNRKKQIQRVKTEMQKLSKTQVPSNIHQIQNNIKSAKDEVSKLENHQNQSIKQIELNKKQSKQQEINLKNKEKNIEDLKHKKQNLNKKVQQQQVEQTQIENQVNTILEKAKLKVQPKVPEQLIVLRKQKEQILHKIKQQTCKYNNEKLNNNSVPPSIIENYKQKIENIIVRNQKYQKLVTENNSLFEENKQLDLNKEKLEWDQNQQVTANELSRKKQEAKHTVLEEELSKVKKNSVQLNQKIEQYQKAYPQFNPEKKTKKQPEPVQQTLAAKKQSEQEQKGNTNKKANKNNKNTSKVEDPVIQPVKKPVVIKQQNKQITIKQQIKPGKVYPQPQEKVSPPKKQQAADGKNNKGKKNKKR